MPSVERSLTIAVPPARVYDAFVDHSRWLQWNPHMREMRPLSEGPLAPGFRARLAAKLNPFASTWEVTEVNPGRSFAWASSSFFPGLRLVFDPIAPAGGGGAGEATPAPPFSWASSSFFPGLRPVCAPSAEGADGGTRAT